MRGCMKYTQSSAWHLGDSECLAHSDGLVSDLCRLRALTVETGSVQKSSYKPRVATEPR